MVDLVERRQHPEGGGDEEVCTYWSGKNFPALPWQKLGEGRKTVPTETSPSSSLSKE